MKLGQVLLAAAVAITSGAAVRADVLTVGSGGFPTVQAAIDAASDGDVIRVQLSSTAPASVDGKGLTIFGDSPGQLRIGGLEVRNLVAGQEVSVSHLNLSPLSSAPLDGLRLQSCAGSVRVVDCRLGKPASAFDGLATGATVDQCSDVVFSRCTLRGENGFDCFEILIPGCGASDAAPGCDVVSSNVALFDCSVVGGRGGDHDSEDAGASGGSGAPALVVVNGFAFLSGGSFTGGDGGDAFGAGLSCTDSPGSGAAGIGLFNPSASVEILDAASAGGSSGQSCVGPPVAAPAVFVSPGASLLDWGDTTRELEVEAPSFELTLTSITVRGIPGDLVHLVLSPAIGFTNPHPIPTINGPKLYAAPVLRRFKVGAIDPSGQLTVSIPTLPLPAGVENRTYFWQAYLDDGASIWATASEPWIILDSSFAGP